MPRRYAPALTLVAVLTALLALPGAAGAASLCATHAGEHVRAHGPRLVVTQKPTGDTYALIACDRRSGRRFLGRGDACCGEESGNQETHDLQ